MEHTSTSSSKTLGIIIVVAIIAVGIWLMTRKSEPAAVLPTANTAQTAGNTASDNGASSVATSGSSDTALDSDSAALDAQLSALSADNAATEESAQ